MKLEEALEIIKVAKAEVEWNFPLDYQEAFDVAIEGIERMIPKKPENVRDLVNSAGYIYAKMGQCPYCGYDVLDGPICPFCGQFILWENFMKEDS